MIVDNYMLKNWIFMVKIKTRYFKGFSGLFKKLKYLMKYLIKINRCWDKSENYLCILSLDDSFFLNFRYLFSPPFSYGKWYFWYQLPHCWPNVKYRLIWTSTMKHWQLQQLETDFKSWQQHPTRHQLYGHLPPITKIIQVRRTRHAGHCWRSRDELIRDVLLWIPTHGHAKAGRPARTYIQQLCEDTGCCPEDLPRAMNDREEWRERVRDIRDTSTIWWWWNIFRLLTRLYSEEKQDVPRHYQPAAIRRIDPVAHGIPKWSKILQCSHQFDARPCVVVVTVSDLTECTIVNMSTAKCCSFNVRLFVWMDC